MLWLLLASLVVLFVVGVNEWWYWQNYRRLPTYDQYRARHPAACPDGQCRCVHCGSRRLRLHSLRPDMRRHLCGNCGALLYRS